MSISPEERESARIRSDIDDAIDGNHTIEQIRQELQNLSNSIDLVRLSLEAIEQNTRVSNREWRVIEVEVENLIPRCDELFNQSWVIDQVLTTNQEVRITVEGPKQKPRTIIMIFWRPLHETKSKGDRANV